MGRLTLKHLRALAPHRILVTNRSPEKAAEVAAGCGGEPIPWAKLGDALARADIVLSTTGAPEPIVMQLLGKLDGRLSDADRQTIERAFRLLQNQFLHGPISALGDASHEGGPALLEALRQIFRLGE